MDEQPQGEPLLADDIIISLQNQLTERSGRFAVLEATLKKRDRDLAAAQEENESLRREILEMRQMFDEIAALPQNKHYVKKRNRNGQEAGDGTAAEDGSPGEEGRGSDTAGQENGSGAGREDRVAAG